MRVRREARVSWSFIVMVWWWRCGGLLGVVRQDMFGRGKIYSVEEDREWKKREIGI